MASNPFTANFEAIDKGNYKPSSAKPVSLGLKPPSANPFMDGFDAIDNPKDAFTSTLKATGAHMLNSALGQPVEDIGAAIGAPAVQQFGKGVREYSEGVQQANPSSINSLSDIIAHPVDAVKSALGNVIPQLPVSLGSAYAGAQLGALTSPVTGPIGPLIGGIAGLALPSYLQEYTEMRGKQHESGQEDIPKALAYAVPAAASDVVMDKVLLGGSKLLPSPLRNAVTDTLAPGASRLTHIGKQGAKGLAGESFQEYGQTYLEQLGGNQDTSTRQAADERNVSAALGGIGGGIIKGGVSAFDARQADPNAGPLSRAAAQAPAETAEQQRLRESAEADQTTQTGAQNEETAAAQPPNPIVPDNTGQANARDSRIIGAGLARSDDERSRDNQDAAGGSEITGDNQQRAGNAPVYFDPIPDEIDPATGEVLNPFLPKAEKRSEIKKAYDAGQDLREITVSGRPVTADSFIMQTLQQGRHTYDDARQLFNDLYAQQNPQESVENDEQADGRTDGGITGQSIDSGESALNNVEHRADADAGRSGNDRLTDDRPVLGNGRGTGGRVGGSLDEIPGSTAADTGGQNLHAAGELLDAELTHDEAQNDATKSSQRTKVSGLLQSEAERAQEENAGKSAGGESPGSPLAVLTPQPASNEDKKPLIPEDFDYLSSEGKPLKHVSGNTYTDHLGDEVEDDYAYKPKKQEEITKAINAIKKTDTNAATTQPAAQGANSLAPGINQAGAEQKADAAGKVADDKVTQLTTTEQPEKTTNVKSQNTTAPNPEGQKDQGQEEQKVGERDRIAKLYGQSLHNQRPDSHNGNVLPDDHHYRLADAIINKQAYALKHLANGMNDVAKKVFSDVTGVALPKQQGATWKAIRDWAGVTDNQDASENAQKHLDIETKKAEKLVGNFNDVRTWLYDQLDKGYTTLANNDSLLLNEKGEGFNIKKHKMAKLKPYIKAEIALYNAKKAVENDQKSKIPSVLP
ncbi:MAG: hypothetical protein PHW53_05150, partial [Patescibacteria group bacterium]|nr:hypothetical protein [Patescibacteria group bacterium]